MELSEELLRRIAAEVYGEFRGLRREIDGGVQEAGRGGSEPARVVERGSGRHPRHCEPDGADDHRAHRLSAVADRLEQIGRAVDGLPETLSLPTLEEKLRTLATAVEHLVSRPPAFGSEAFAQIEVRLDEIARAVLACSAQPLQVDAEPFQRIEARIAALARQIEEVARERPADELGALGQRVDEMDRQIQRRLDEVAGRLESFRGDAGSAPVNSIAARLEALAEHIEESLAALAHELEVRARRSDERNSKMLGAIHDTLLRIVDRRGEGDASLEGSRLAGHLEPAVARSIHDVVVALDAAVVPPIGQRRSVRSTLGGLFSARREHSAQMSPQGEHEGRIGAMATAPVPPDAPLDPGIGSRPLGHGPRASDPDTVVRLRRQERARPAKAADADAAGSDVIAAARRAARAAAAEAEALERAHDAALSAASPLTRPSSLTA